MARIRRAEAVPTPETSIYRVAYLEMLARRRERWAALESGVGHRHGSRTMVASIDSERSCLTCGAAQQVAVVDRKIADVEAGRPAVDDGGAFGVPRSRGERYVLEADGTVTPVRLVHVDDTVHWQRPDGSLVSEPTKTRTRTTRSNRG